MVELFPGGTTEPSDQDAGKFDMAARRHLRLLAFESRTGTFGVDIDPAEELPALAADEPEVATGYVEYRLTDPDNWDVVFVE